MVPARITVVTLGARDLPGLRDFYVALGWKLAVDMDDFAAFETRGAVLTLYRLDSLNDDAGLHGHVPEKGPRGSNLAINVDEPEQVDEAIEGARTAGAKIAREPYTADWGGRTAYFLDPEENLWEVAWVPQDSVMAGLVRKALGETG